MEEPNAGIVSHETQCRTTHRGDLQCVPAYRVCLTFLQRGIQRRVIRRVVGRAADDLEFMAVQMAKRSCREFSLLFRME